MFLFWEVGGWISEGIRQTTWMENGKCFGGNIYELSSCRKEQSEHFPVEDGNNSLVENGIFQTLHGGLS